MSEAVTLSEKLNLKTATKFIKRLESIHEFAKTSLHHAQELKTNNINKHWQSVNWTTNNKVYLLTKNLCTGQSMKKLKNKFEGLFSIVKQKNHLYKLRLSKSWKIHSTFAPELLCKVSDNLLSKQNILSNSDNYYDEVMKDKEYKVKKILTS